MSDPVSSSSTITLSPSPSLAPPLSSHATTSSPLLDVVPPTAPTVTTPSTQLKSILSGLRSELSNFLSAKDLLVPYLANIKSFFTDFSLQTSISRKHKIYVMLFGGALTLVILLYKVSRPPPKRITFATLRPSPHDDLYDVIVVGAGPSGTACAYHLAKKGKKVLLLEKKAFPRDKYCGEAVTHYAQEQLQEMGVLQGILDDNLAHSVDVGGFISPCGNSFVGSSRSVMEHAAPPTNGSPPPSPSSRPSSPRPPSPAPAPSATNPSRPPSPRPHSPTPAPPLTSTGAGFRGVLTIKRMELDHRLAKAAQLAGAVLVENMHVVSADFDSNTGVWTVECKDEQTNNLHIPTTPHAHTHPTAPFYHRGSISMGISTGSSSGITTIMGSTGITNSPSGSFNSSTGSTGSTGSTTAPEASAIPVSPPAPLSTEPSTNATSQEKIIYRGRSLVCADGASSRLARSLGVVHSEPTAVCSRSYVQPPHAFKWDALLFYPPSILPGCCAIVKQVGGEISYLTFVNPAIGGQAKEEDLSRLHHEFIKADPYISQALGPFIYLERMKAASLRIGGVGTGISLSNFRTVSTSRTPKSKDRSYGDHLLVVGDAAGFVDPFTGLGLQYALEGGKIAAGVLLEGFYKRDLSAQFLEVYEKRWGEAFGNQFYWSLKMGQLLCRFPILLDAIAKLIQRRGDQFLAEWMQAMTGTRSKTWFLSLAVWPFLFAEIILELVRRQFRQR